MTSIYDLKNDASRIRAARASTLFVDYASLAVGAHVAHTYGNMRTIAHPVRGGLAACKNAA